MLPEIRRRSTYTAPLRRFLELLKSKQFLGLTLIGNGYIGVLSVVFYAIEKEDNYLITTWLDSLWWAFATVTTVGYGDIVPMTDLGKIMGMASMLIGTGLFASYTALFANALLGREVIKEVVTEEEEELLLVIDNLKDQINRLERKVNRK